MKPSARTDGFDEEDAALERAIEVIFRKIEEADAKTRQHQAEIDRLRTETRQLLAELKSLDSQPRSHRIAGLHTGAIRMSEDFDAPLPSEWWVE